MLEVFLCAVSSSLREDSEDKFDIAVESSQLAANSHDDVLFPFFVVMQLLGGLDQVGH